MTPLTVHLAMVGAPTAGAHCYPVVRPLVTLVPEHVTCPDCLAKMPTSRPEGALLLDPKDGKQ